MVIFSWGKKKNYYHQPATATAVHGIQNYSILLLYIMQSCWPDRSLTIWAGEREANNWKQEKTSWNNGNYIQPFLKKTFNFFSILQHQPSFAPFTTPYKTGQYIAVNCHKYDERPLIRQITTTDDKKCTATIDWLIRTYTGTCRVWKGREGRRSVIMTDEITVT